MNIINDGRDTQIKFLSAIAVEQHNEIISLWTNLERLAVQVEILAKQFEVMVDLFNKNDAKR